MPHLFGRNYTRQELAAKLTRIEQIGGVRRVRLAQGMEAGVEALQMRTGTGLSFLVVADRALDVATADWQGRSLCWEGAAGVAHPGHLDAAEFNWLRSFFGGLLTTCGLTWFGAPSQDPDAQGAEGPSLGLHGRLSHQPAEQVNCGGEWEGDEYVMWIEGVVREWMLHGPHLELRRRLWARLGENRLHIRDVVTNRAFTPQEHMLLYHFNPGFPLMDEGARYLFPTRQVTPLNALSAGQIDRWDTVLPPRPGEPETLFYHQVAADAEGRTVAALVNRVTEPQQPLALAIRYDTRVLPELMQWKNPCAGAYVTGIEAGTSRLETRPVERASGRVVVLEPGEARTYELTVEVLTSEQEISALEQEVAALSGGQPPQIVHQPPRSG